MFTQEEYAKINMYAETLLRQRSIVKDIVRTIPTGKPLVLPRYAAPTRTDMAVIIVYFNPNFSVRLMQNFLLVRHTLLQVGIPLFTGELAFDETPFILADATVQTRTTSYMFYKENLVKAVEAKIPATYTKLCVLDADILFEQHDWYDTVSATLDTAEVCKPFTSTTYMGINFREEATVEGGHHAIAYQRGWAFTDQTVIGSGNLLLESQLPSRIVSFYKDALALPELPPLATCPLTVYHLYHGTPKNRDPDGPTVALQVAFHRLGVSKLNEVLDRRDDRILEWKKDAKQLLNTVMQKYFVGRKDDEAGTNNNIKFYPTPYTTPLTQDMAVLIVFFNPTPYNRIIQNVLTVKQFMDAAKIPYFIAELAFEDRPFLFNKEPHIFQYRSDSYMFYKENLITSTEPLLPPQYTKLCLMDADIMFDNPNWYSAISNTLNRVKVTQPFKRACWMEPNYTINRERTNCLDIPDGTHVDFTKEHTGFIWAFDREWFKKCKFVDITGTSSSGDALLYNFIKNQHKDTMDYYKFYMSFYNPKMNVTGLTYESCNLTIYHFNHGSLTNRQYASMIHRIKEKLRLLQVKNGMDIFIRREDNILEWAPKYKDALNEMYRTYFKERQEDKI